MKFQSGTRRRALEYEKELVKYWKENKTFEKSIELRSKENAYVFYDGPPFITGVPHHGTLLSSIVKDAVPRYWTMKGKRVERVWGWDTHGLPAENFVEKQLGIVDRRQIVTTADAPAPLDKDGNELPTVTLEHYITKARESMVANAATWEDVIDRVGRWVDFKGAYKTMDKDFMESVWWAFKTLYEKGKIYEGEKVLMYDTRFATPVSKNEVTMDNDAYQTVTDPSVYVKFKLENGSTLLAWTTTPWTLPGNTALAVNPELDYVEVAVKGEQLILAKELVSKVLMNEKKQPLNFEVLRELKGEELVGLSYEPLFANHGENAHKVWAADYVSADSGTGIVHLAPIYGEEDFVLAQAHNIPRVHVLDDNGFYYPEVAAKLYELMPWLDNTKPLEVWDNNKNIAKALEKAGVVWKIEYIQHEYPFNPRSKQRIMYRAIPSWFFDVQGSKPLMLEQNENINWFPPHLKHGRFQKNIEQAPDWNLSRDRFWATAMPVWKGDKGTVKVVGSYQELKDLSGVELEDYHRPWVDDITFDIDGEHFTRIDKVLDCWFESGSMPFAQLHYPFENKEKFEQNYPADFIVEYIGQVRAWFYYVHTVNTALFGDHAFNNVITTGVVAGNDGRKMSKSLGNFTDPNELMDKFSADSLRFLLLSSPLLKGEDFALQDKDVGDVARKLSMVWNMYDFFTMYAEVDGWEFNGELVDPSDEVTNPLDQWIISRVHQLLQEIETNMDAYDIPNATSPILPFLDDASNWYVRRSRRRFWKSEDDTDKNNAYKTLHYVLVRLSQGLAPFVPFMAEELYQKLTGGESVHLTDWPEVGHANELVLERMARTREIIEQGLGLRMFKDENEVQIKVRQPLSKLTYGGEKLDDFYESIIAEEVNVKEVAYGDFEFVTLDKTISPELRREGMAREVIRHVQAARKAAGLNVDDRIELGLNANEPELQKALTEHRDIIASETLAESIVADATYSYETDAWIEGFDLHISLQKV
jgi:isoleucyl-tRNA synthetase